MLIKTASADETAEKFSRRSREARARNRSRKAREASEGVKGAKSPYRKAALPLEKSKL
jgi:hypothetical protein